MTDSIRLAAAFCVHDDHWLVTESVGPMARVMPTFVFVSRKPWFGESGDYERVCKAAAECGAEVIVGDWEMESAHRKHAFSHLTRLGFTHMFCLDTDEVLEEEFLGRIIELAARTGASVIRTTMNTYWKDRERVVWPRERLYPAVLVRLDSTVPFGIRRFRTPNELVLGPGRGVLHHLSYVGPDARIERKLATWGHKYEVQPGWYNRVWKGWDENPDMTDLHPTHPPAYKRALPLQVVQSL